MELARFKYRHWSKYVAEFNGRRIEQSRFEYRTLLEAKADVAEYFVLFVVEATGRLGPAVIDDVLKESKIKFARQHFLLKIGAIIACYNAMMALMWAKKLGPREVE